MNGNDLEFVTIFVIIFFLFLIGLRKKVECSNNKIYGIDLPLSTALKGIACVLILMGHFVNLRMGAGIKQTLFSRLIYFTTANIALTIFMYFSGYGLSVKKLCGGGISNICIKRLKKVYFPLLVTCIVTMLIYATLPIKFSSEEIALLRIPKDIELLHDFTPANLFILLPHLFGWRDWYVCCIIIFYLMFYLSQYLSLDKSINQTWLLWLMFIGYFVLAYFYFGPSEAHWYRYCWAFFLGHVHAKVVKTNKIERGDIIMLALLLSTMIIESRFMIISYLMAIIILTVCIEINRKYEMDSRILAYMGSISFFFYLSHIRIGYIFVSYLNFYSVIFWIFLAQGGLSVADGCRCLTKELDMIAC